MNEALLYQLIDQEKHIIQCRLCNHHCLIKDDHCGICQVRKNQGGRLFSLNYGRLVSQHIDPIEKKPLFHFLPSSLSYSIATVGCNFRCLHCQNYDISQYPRIHSDVFPGRFTTPSEVVSETLRTNCQSISYTYVEPTIFFEFALETARLAHEVGIKNVFVSNGYTSPEATKMLAPFLDANNIDLKAFTEKFYHEVCGAKLAPVLNTIKLMHDLGVWIEITTLIIPGWNDSENELRDIANFIAAIDRNIPWHVTRFFPTYKMLNRMPTPVTTLKLAREIGLAAGLHFVYTGNIPGDDGDNTFCPNCQALLIERTGFHATPSGIIAGACRFCRLPIPGIF